MRKAQLVTAVIEAPSACKEFKQAARNYLDIPSPENAKILLAEAEEDITDIDDCIAFMASDMAKKFFGEELANEKLEHMKEIKAQGAEFCDCPGCTAAKNIIDNKELFI